MSRVKEESHTFTELVSTDTLRTVQSSTDSNMTSLAHYPAQMSFIAPRQASDEPPFYRSAADEGFEVCNFTQQPHSVTVHDARPLRDSFQLDTHGFAFAVDSDGSRPEILETIRAGDKEAVRDVYYPLVEQIIKRETGASRVVIFDHTVRRREASLAGKNPDGREQPASTVSVLVRMKLARG